MTASAAGCLVLGTSIGLFSPSAARADTAVASASPLSAYGFKPAAPADAPAPPRILFGGAALPVPSADRAPYRDPADGQVCLSPDMLAPLGVTYIVDAESGVVSLAGPNGGAATTTAPIRRRPGSESDAKPPVFVAAKQVVEALGGKWQETDRGATCSIRSVLTGISMIGGQLRIQATLPILPVVLGVDTAKPNQIVIDVPGTDAGAAPRSLKLDSPNVAQARCGQYQDGTTRIVLEMKDAAAGRAPATYVVLGKSAATQVALNPAAPVVVAAAAPPAMPAVDTGGKTGSGGGDKPSAAAAQPSIVISNDNASRTIVAKSPSAAAAAQTAKSSRPSEPPTVIRGVTFRNVSDREAQIVVQAGRSPDLRADMSKGRLTIDLANATLAGDAVASALASAKHPFLKAAQLLPRGSAAAQLVLDLSRTVAYTVQMQPAGFVLDLMLPQHAGGKLKGKLVVVDAGHGKQDSGARGGGASEKNVNLAIAKKLASTLREMGANVIMTRADDSFLPVNERPAIANRAGADFFVSIHADSGDYNHSVNGSTVYYHMQLPSCKALAQCIADRLGDMGGIRTKGAHSDGRQYGGRFVQGYGVLRNAQMVAVLCECGYMSNAGDVSRLTDSAMQQKIAGAIASGIKDYVEGNPDFDTRNVQPQPEGALEPLPAAPPLDGGGNAGDPQAVPSDMGGAASADGTSGGGSVPTGDAGSSGSEGTGGATTGGDSSGVGS